MTATPIEVTVSEIVGGIDGLVASGIDPSGAATIQRSGSLTIILLTYPGGNNAATLLTSSGWQIGDVIEVHNTDPVQGIAMYPDAGVTINGMASSEADPNSLNLRAKSVTVLRKITSTNWSVLYQSTFGP